MAVACVFKFIRDPRSLSSKSSFTDIFANLHFIRRRQRQMARRIWRKVVGLVPRSRPGKFVRSYLGPPVAYIRLIKPSDSLSVTILLDDTGLSTRLLFGGRLPRTIRDREARKHQHKMGVCGAPRPTRFHRAIVGICLRKITPRQSRNWRYDRISCKQPRCISNAAVTTDDQNKIYIGDIEVQEMEKPYDTRWE